MPNLNDFLRLRYPKYLMLSCQRLRPAEVETLLGDPSKAKTDLGWIPEITLDAMVAEMVTHDLNLAKQHALLKANGYNVDVSKE